MFPKLKQINQFCKQPPEKKKKTNTQLQTDTKKNVTWIHKQYKNTPPALPLHPFLFKPGLWNFVGHVWAKKKIRTLNLCNEALQKGWMNQAQNWISKNEGFKEYIPTPCWKFPIESFPKNKHGTPC